MSSKIPDKDRVKLEEWKKKIKGMRFLFRFYSLQVVN